MINRINQLIKVAEYLGDSSIQALLEKWALTMQQNEKPLPFIGRFSAGKSSLINALLDDHVLPTATVETTAALTKIGYAATSRAEIIFQDGSHKAIDLSEVEQLGHKNIEKSEVEIASINVGMPIDILKTGLTFIDSPGMDTILNNHVTLAEYLMREAIMTVYVMGGAPTAFDIGIIKQLQQNGVGVIVVRTHMDSINREEESFMDAMVNDEGILAEQLDYVVEYFALSSSPDAPEAPHNEFIRFREYLKDCVAAKINEVFAKRLATRLDKIEKDFKEQLGQRKKMAVEDSLKTESELDANIQTIERAKKGIEQSIDDIQDSLARDKSKISRRLSEDIEDACNNNCARFRSSLDSFISTLPSKGAQRQDKIGMFFQAALANAGEELGGMVTSEISKWAAKSTTAVEIDFSELSKTLAKSNIPFDAEFNMDKVAEITERQESLLEKIQILSENAEELQKYSDEQLRLNGTQREELEASISQLKQVEHEAVDALNMLNNNYEPRYIEKPSKMGKFMGKIGNIADIALLAVPAIGWEKGAAMLSSKAIALAGKGTKAAQVASEAANYGSKACKLLASTDTTKDIAFLLGTATDRIAGNSPQNGGTNLIPVNTGNQGGLTGATSQQILPEKKKSFFDFLSVSYWFEKFGEMIDPPTKEIDQQYERRYREAQDACQQRAFTVARQRINEERELKRIKNDTEAREMENKFRKAALEREAAQCERQLKKLSEEKERAIQNAFKEAMVVQYSTGLNKLAKRIIRDIDPILESVYKNILAAASQNAYSQLDAIQRQLEAIKEAKKNCSGNNALVSGIDQIIATLN